MGLTPRQTKFVQEYLTCGNGAEAARRAGYSHKTAHVQASQLLSRLNIQAAVQEGQQKLHTCAGVTAEQITEELAKIGLAVVPEAVKLTHKLKALELLIRQVHLASLEERLAAIEQLLAPQVPKGALRAV